MSLKIAPPASRLCFGLWPVRERRTGPDTVLEKAWSRARSEIPQRYLSLRGPDVDTLCWSTMFLHQAGQEEINPTSSNRVNRRQWALMNIGKTLTKTGYSKSNAKKSNQKNSIAKSISASPQLQSFCLLKTVCLHQAVETWLYWDASNLVVKTEISTFLVACQKGRL